MSTKLEKVLKILGFYVLSLLITGIIVVVYGFIFDNYIAEYSPSVKKDLKEYEQQVVDYLTINKGYDRDEFTVDRMIRPYKGRGGVAVVIFKDEPNQKYYFERSRRPVISVEDRPGQKKYKEFKSVTDAEIKSRSFRLEEADALN